ncbi:hypothetical protein [Actinomadura livida]|uniref:hypothetical protein n=1 Tax=Actinomadura livida TaxID=79909 RepID=UPI003570CC63
MGRAARYSAATISRLETGRDSGTDAVRIRAVANAVGRPPDVLAVLLGVGRAPTTTVVTTVTSVVQEDDPMRRRSLLTAGLAVPLAALTRLDDALALPPAPAGPVTGPQVAAQLKRGLVAVRQRAGDGARGRAAQPVRSSAPGRRGRRPPACLDACGRGVRHGGRSAEQGRRRPAGQTHRRPGDDLRGALGGPGRAGRRGPVTGHRAAP